MKKIKIIQNPSSGRAGHEDEFKTLCFLLIDAGYTVDLFKTQKKYDAFEEAKRAVHYKYDVIIVCGGDGTVNEVAKALYEMKSHIPMAIFMTGTVNDFAHHLKLPRTAIGFVKMIEKAYCEPVDIGLINGEVFVNIAAAGLFTSVAHDTKKEVKKYLGRTAYYLEGIANLTQLTKSYRLRITSEEFSTVDDYHLFLVTNSTSVGGFDRMSPIAEIQDGYFDCVFIKKAHIVGQADVFLNILMGRHLDNKNVDYFRTKKLTIEQLGGEPLVVDIDGEFGGGLPITIEVVPSAIRVISVE